MTTTNSTSGTRIDEIAADIYRIHTPIPGAPGGFSFNQYLVLDEQPLLFHTGPRRLGAFVREAIAAVMPIERLRFIGFAHVESDECGALNELLAVAPQAEPLCSKIAALVSVEDLADRPPRALADGESLVLGKRTVTWIDAPHVPHGWENGFLHEQSTRTLFCGDLFTQGGSDHPPVTERDILGPSEGFRAVLDYYAHTSKTGPILAQLAALEAETLACMHGSAWRGNAGELLRGLSRALASSA
jgi:flavorubredoxin